jgi:hypothetical protein
MFNRKDRDSDVIGHVRGGGVLVADEGNRNHSGRGGKTHKTFEKEKGTGMGRGAK